MSCWQFREELMHPQLFEEKALQDIGQIIQQILSSFPEGVVVYDTDLKCQVWNPFMEKLTGVPASKIIGRHPVEHLPFLRDTGVWSAVERALKEGLTTATEVPFTDPDTGRQEWAVDTSSPLRDSQGRIIGVIGLVRNETRNKLAIAEQIHRQNLMEAQQWKRRYELIAAAAGMIAYDYNFADNSIEWGGSIEQVLGYTLSEMNGGLAQWEDMIDPADRRETIRLLKIAQRDSTPFIAEYAFRHKRGHYVQIRDHGLFLHDSQGKPSRLIGVMQDITQQKKAQEALRESRQTLQTMVDASPVAISWSDSRGNIEHDNRKFYDLFGYHPEDIPTVDAWFEKAFPDPAYRDEIRTRWNTAIAAALTADDTDIAPIETRITAKNGAVRDVIMFGAIAANRIVSTFIDITDRKQAARAIEHAKKDWERTFDTVPDLIALIDRNHRITRANKAMAGRLGTTPAGCVGKLCYEIVHCENAPPAACPHAQLLKDHKEHTAEIHLPNLGGYFVVSTSPLFDSTGQLSGCVHVARDVTDRKKLEDQFRQSQKMQAFGQLAGGVAHDFNNILTVIMAHASMLKRSTRTREQQQESIVEISQAADRAAMLTRQLLTFSRRQTMQPKHVNLNDIVTGMSKMLYRLIGEHISLQTRLASGGASVLADPGMMEQVIMNLAVNSRDAMPRGGQFLLETTSVIIDRELALTNPKAKIGQYIRLSVTDTGCGIPPGLISHIFEPFFTTKEDGKGTGLGLATVFGIVEQHNGWITVDSQVGRGTTFHIYLPHQAAPAGTEARKNETMPDARGGTETILLVEDEPAVRKLLRGILERYGYRILEAESGLAALNLWQEKRQSIDLLLTDIVMPQGISGWELAERLKAEKPKLKVIYSSGYNPEMSGEDSPRRRGCLFLRKPFELSVVLKTIRDALDAR